MSGQPVHASNKSITHLHDDEDLVIDGETQIDDLTMTKRVAEWDMRMAEDDCKTEDETPVKQVKTIDEVNAEMSSDSEDEKEDPAPKEILQQKHEEQRSELESILAKNGMEVISDDEEDLPELSLKLPDLQITVAEDQSILPLGTVQHVIGAEMAVVQSAENSRAVDINGIVVTKDRQVVGVIVDTLGMVKRCHYSIALTEASRKWVSEGMEVFVQEEGMSYVLDTAHDQEALAALQDELSDDYTDEEGDNPPQCLMNQPAM